MHHNAVAVGRLKAMIDFERSYPHTIFFIHRPVVCELINFASDALRWQMLLLLTAFDVG
jgi:hypothetical protein